MDYKKQIDEVLKKAVEENEVAGVNLLIINDGKEVIYKECGYADIEEKKRYTRDTMVRLYSMTKPITAVAAMILMERGLLDLGSGVEEYLPGFKNQMVAEANELKPVKRNVLVKDLLSMTSGLTYGGDVTDLSATKVGELFEEIDKKLYTNDQMSTLEIANKIGKCPLQFHPGEEWQYGTSADVLAAVIEVISGMTFGSFLQKEIFTPLGMHDTAFFVPEEKQSRLAKVYEYTNAGLKECKTNHLGIMYTQKMKPAFESGGAGLVSTLDDYAKFAQMLLQDGVYQEQQILSSNTVKFLTQAKLTLWQQENMCKKWESLYGYTYGNLLRILDEPGMAFMNGTKGEYGWDGWLGAYFCNSPRDNMTMLMTVQHKDAGTMPLTRKIKNIVYSALC